MKIDHKFNLVEGVFDTKRDKLICVTSDKYAETKLCFKANMNIPFAKIKLYSKDLFIDAKAVNEDAYKLGKEISTRWNMHDELIDISKRILKKLESPTESVNGLDQIDLSNIIKKAE